MHTGYLRKSNCFSNVLFGDIENLSVVDMVLLEHVHIKSQHPYVKDKNSNPSPGGESLENLESFSIERSWTIIITSMKISADILNPSQIKTRDISSLRYFLYSV